METKKYILKSPTYNQLKKIFVKHMRSQCSNFKIGLLKIVLLVLLINNNVSGQVEINSNEEQKFFETEIGNHSRILNYFSDPRANNINIYYTRLTITLDPDTLYVKGNVSTSFVANRITDTLFFDLEGSLQVDSVLYHNSNVNFSQSINNSIWIKLPQQILTDAFDSVVIFYQGVPIGDGFGGFDKGIHDTDKYCLFNSSEPYTSRHWWPCKQSLTDKIDSIDIIIQHPDGYIAASNGLLISEISTAGWTTTHWKHTYPIVPYLIGVAVANYSVYEDTVLFISGDSLVILNYVFPEYSDTAKKYSKELIPVMKFFAEKFGDYPFMNEKYGHAQWTKGGGMEYQTMSFVGSMNYNLLAHELAHQWFGDKLTCGTWRDIWLNEGFATYCTGLCIEHFYPENFFDWKKNNLSLIEQAIPQSVWVWDTSWNARIFDYKLTYAKGAYLLHMLRWKIGDEDFFSAIKNYLSDTLLAYNFAFVPQLIHHFENQSGQNLSAFFDQWYYGSGHPTYHLQWHQDFEKNTTIFLGQETSNPASITFFSMPVPIRFFGDGKDTLIIFDNIFNDQLFSLSLSFMVDSIVIDPDLQLISFNNTVVRVPGFELGSLTLFPNPASSEINLFYSATFVPKSVFILDAVGKKLFSSDINADKFSGKYVIQTGQFPAGLYLIKVKTESEERILKWVKAN